MKSILKLFILILNFLRLGFIYMLKLIKKVLIKPYKKVNKLKVDLVDRTSLITFKVKRWKYEMYSRWHVDWVDQKLNLV